ncbi:MAG: protease modulator HflC [Candidatus Glassbacteria bacterium]
MRTGKILTVLIILAAIVLISAAFVVDETNQVVITQMGKPVRTVREPGLYFKIPFPIQQVNRFDDRLLEYDSAPTEIITKDKKNLVIDNYALWRIIDPLKFMQAVRDENGAQSRLDDIIYSMLRVELGKYDLHDIVAISREEIMETVTGMCNQKALEYGIEVLDVRIKRADLPEENEKHVFDRMRAERQRMANQYRSEGEEEATKIRAETDKEKVIILAEAYREAQKTKGEGDAEAARIYANAFGRAPAFYEFVRTLEAYEQTIDENTTIVLSPEAEFFEYLWKSGY